MAGVSIEDVLDLLGVLRAMCPTSYTRSVRFGRRSRSAQRGVSLVLIALVLGVLAVGLVGFGRSQVRTASERAGQSVGSAIEAVSDAVNQYRTTNAATLSSATPTVPGFANPMVPTIAELKTNLYLNANVADSLGDYGAYNIAILKNPAGCIGPATNCQVWSRINPVNPIVDKRSNTPDVAMLAGLISRLGEAASYSAAPTPATIVGGNGAWSIANPDGANRAGILVVVAGLGGSDGPWLRVQDTRNPDFRGPSVTGIQFDTEHKTIGAACTPQGAFASAAQGIVYCNAGVWVLYAGELGTGAGACNAEGKMGYTSAGRSLICVANVWRDHLTYGFRGVGYYAHNAIVPQPTCGAGLSPQAAVSGVSASVIIGANNPGNNTGSWQADINAATWEVRIMGSDGSQAGTNARALVTTFCALA